MADYPPTSRFPYPLRLAIEAEKKPTRYYDQPENLAQGRKRAVGAIKQRFALKQILKRLDGL